MLYPLAALVLGIVVLLWSADLFVEGAATVAKRLGMSELIIGMVIVGFGTSLPEMLVSALSAIEGASGIALGNAYGSNFANITLILGATAIVNPVPVNATAAVKEMYALLLATLFAAVLGGWGLYLSRSDALLHLAFFAVLMFLSFRRNQAAGQQEQALAAVNQVTPPPVRRSLFQVTVGLVLLIASSRALVWGAVSIARVLEISELTIGLTIVAVGTSLPEFASSLAAARKKHHDIVVGNIIGSNLFNTLAVVGIAGAIKPLEVPAVILWRDLLAVTVATLLLFQFCRPRRDAAPLVISRARGWLLLTLFVLYTVWVILTS
ncbi:MAG: calcium/sodium antiporter [Planctomycetota bacterium]|jgi:cation:H+ antiporter|nr:calcium/sodium antiporter [Planctomycetota bacterium]